MAVSAVEQLEWHALTSDQAVAAWSTDDERGLAADEVAARRARHGPNALPEPAPPSPLRRFLRQLESPLIYLLLGAAALAVGLGHVSDAIVIAVVVALNTVVGALQEDRAERALTGLRRMVSHAARVRRDGRDQLIEASDLVPGDILLLAAGDAITADARLLDGAALQIAEAALTGESAPVAKTLSPVSPDTPLADRQSMVHAGTHVTAGRARAVVVATGVRTELGRIAKASETATPPPTPLEHRVERLGRTLMIVAAVTFVVVVAVGAARGVPLGQIAMVAISQVVGLIPEGLPVAMTIALAVGVQRMARRRALVRRLAAVETLGSTTVICTDKTGTLTCNEMTATALFLPGRGELEVTGVGYGPEGECRDHGRALSAERAGDLRALLEAAVLCNDADVLGPDGDAARWRALGDPTEAALVTLAIKAGLVPDEIRRRAPRRAELPFDAAAQLMATQHDLGGRSRVVIKGAPEAVLALAGTVGHGDQRHVLDDDGRAALRGAAEAMATRALRVLAIAVVDDAELDSHAGAGALRGKATLLGLVGQIDPPRPGASHAVAVCRAAGVRTIMITGDHAATALAIGRDIGLAGPGDRALDGRALEQLSDDELAAQLDTVSVFARVHPAQKLRLVEAYQRRHEVVAMTGDGVNDAPALVRADVGVAMGVTGTEVAKEAAAIVIADDDFATIGAAVEEGRVVYRNIKKAVLFLTATSLAEVLILLVAMLAGYPPPFAAVQILWNNLVTEGVITVNLVMEGPEGDEMRGPPVARSEALLSRDVLWRLATMTPTIVACTLGWYAWRLAHGAAPAVAQSESFTLLVVCEWFNVLSCRSATRSAFHLDLLRNRWLVAGLVAGNLLQVAVIFLPPMNRIFHTVPFHLDQVLAIGAVGSVVLWVEELRKLLARTIQRRSRRSMPRPGLPSARCTTSAGTLPA